MSKLQIEENTIAPATPAAGKSIIYPKADGLWYSKDDAGVETPLGGSTGAPADGTYITQTPHAGLSAEQALSLLASGVLKVTTATGVVASEPFTGLTTDYMDGVGDFRALPAFGDVVGPASAVDDRIATFDGATGKLIQDGGQTIAQVIAAGGGITELTGDVTAGPGTGSQAATIGTNKVVTAKILDANVTFAKIQDASGASKLLGRGSASGGGDFEEITLGANLSLAGTVLSGANQNAAGFLVASGTLTDTQIKAMFAAPIIIVAAAAGFTHFGVYLELSPNFSAGVYATGGNINIYRGAAAPNPARMGPFSAGLMNSATKRTFRGFPLLTTALNMEDDNANSANQPLVFSNATAAYTGGNAANTVVYKFTYVTVVSP